MRNEDLNMMKSILLILVCSVCFSVACLWAQTGDPSSVSQLPEFKSRYAGTTVDAGFMFMPSYGSGIYVAPKFSFQVAPRLFLSTGVSVVQYNLTPAQTVFEDSSPRTVTGAYVFVEGSYLLNERWSVNGSMMKNTTPEPVRNAMPYRLRMPNEAAHFGVNYQVTPNISVGARVGYSNGGGNMYYPY